MSSLPPPHFFVANLNDDDVDSECELEDDSEDDNTVMEGESDDDFEEEPRGPPADARLLPPYAPAAAPFLIGGRASAQQLDNAYASEWMQMQARDFDLGHARLEAEDESEAAASDDDEIVSNEWGSARLRCCAQKCTCPL